MNWLDIVTLVIACAFVAICAWRGFLKIVLRFGALVLSLICAKIFGSVLGNALFPSIVKSDSMDAEVLADINSSIASLLGTVVLFIILFIVLRIVATLVAKALTGKELAKAADKLLGAAVGVVFALGALFAFVSVLHIVAMVMSFVGSNVIYEAVDASLFFKFFF